MSKIKWINTVVFSLMFGINSWAYALNDNQDSVKKSLIKSLSGVISNIEHASIKATGIAGIYEIILGAELVYVSQDGKFLIQGEMFDLVGGTNITKDRKAIIIGNLLDSIADTDKITFKAKDEKYSIHVFTDVDCPYCQKLHKEVPALNKLGVTVKYLASPLAQLHPTAQEKMQSIWCAGDNKAKKLAIDKYKKTKRYTKTNCTSTAVAQQLALAQQLGVNGTPSIFLSDGTNIPGFVPAKRLIRRIKAAAQ